MLVRNGTVITKEEINGFTVELMYPLDYFLDAIRGELCKPVGYSIEDLYMISDKIIMLINEILNDDDYPENCFEEFTYSQMKEFASYQFGDFRVVKHENGIDTLLMMIGDISYLVEYSLYFCDLTDDTTLTIEKDVCELLAAEREESLDFAPEYEAVLTISKDGVVEKNYSHLTEEEKDLIDECIAINQKAEFYHLGTFDFA